MKGYKKSALLFILVCFSSVLLCKNTYAKSTDEIVSEQYEASKSYCKSGDASKDGTYTNLRRWLENGTGTGDNIEIQEGATSMLHLKFTGFIVVCQLSSDRAWRQAKFDTTSLQELAIQHNGGQRQNVGGYIWGTMVSDKVQQNASSGTNNYNKSGVTRSDVYLPAPSGGWKKGTYTIYFKSCASFRVASSSTGLDSKDWHECNVTGESSLSFNIAASEDWDIGAVTKVNKVEAKPNTSVSWEHRFVEFGGTFNKSITGRFGYNEVKNNMSDALPSSDTDWDSGLISDESYNRVAHSTIDGEPFYYSALAADGWSVISKRGLGVYKTGEGSGITGYLSSSPTETTKTSRAINSDDVGKRICQRARFIPDSWSNLNSWESAFNRDAGSVGFGWHCVSVPYNYDIYPFASWGTTGVEVGSTVIGTGRIESKDIARAGLGSYRTNSRQNASYKLYAYVQPKGGRIPECASVWASRVGCIDEVWYDNNYGLDLGLWYDTFGRLHAKNNTSDLPDPTLSITVPSTVKVGDQICIGLMISKFNHNEVGEAFRNSDPKCISVGKRPKLQILGGGVYAPAGIKTSQSFVGGKLYGSWVEYEAIAGYYNASHMMDGKISGFSSSSGLNGGLTGGATTTDKAKDWSKLTLANKNKASDSVFPTACDSGAMGCYYMETNTIQYIVDRMQNNIPSSTKKLTATTLNITQADDFAKSKVATPYKGDLAITGGVIPKGKSVVLIADGTVTINSNITYTEDLMNSVLDIPQVIIIADNIEIAENVTQIDAWLIAHNPAKKTDTKPHSTITTCNAVKSVKELNANICNKPLTVNGPVAAATLNLWRTYGGDKNTLDQAAEVFNLPSYTYMWVASMKTRDLNGSSRMRVVYMREGAPRL